MFVLPSDRKNLTQPRNDVTGMSRDRWPRFCDSRASTLRWDQSRAGVGFAGPSAGRRPRTSAWRSSGASARPRNRRGRGCGQRRPRSGTTRPVPRASKAWQRVWRFGRSSVERRIDRFIIPLGDCLALCRGPNPCPTVQVAVDVPAATVLMEPRIRQTASRARQQSRLHRSHRLRLEASSANATTPYRRNLRANVLHLITAARRTFRLMTHDLLATFVYVAHFVFTEH